MLLELAVYVALGAFGLIVFYVLALSLGEDRFVLLCKILLLGVPLFLVLLVCCLWQPRLAPASWREYREFFKMKNS